LAQISKGAQTNRLQILIPFSFSCPRRRQLVAKADRQSTGGRNDNQMVDNKFVKRGQMDDSQTASELDTGLFLRCFIWNFFSNLEAP
jgi:hypothetical protein